MEWSSDTFTPEDASLALAFFGLHDVTPSNCATFGRYLDEMPPAHTAEAYVGYCEQLSGAATRVAETDNMAAELWLWALTVRALSFEVEQGFEGAMKGAIARTHGP